MSLKRIHAGSVLSFLLVSIMLGIILYPLVLPGFPVTDDGSWMIIRLSAFYQSLREGQFPVRFLGRLNHNYGYPVADFLYPGFLYIGSIFKFVGFSFVGSVKLIVMLSIIGSSVGIYKWLRLHYSSVASSIGVLSFLTNPYIVFDVYTRGSVGELLGICSLAILLWLLQSKRYYISAFVVGLLIISHNTIALLSLICISIYVIWTGQWKILSSLMGGLGLSAFFWIPAIFDQRYVKFTDLQVSDPLQYFVQGKFISLMPVLFLIAILILISTNKLSERKKIFWIYSGIALGSLCMSMPISSVFWTWKPLASIVQFPYRFLALTGIFGSWIIAQLVDHIPVNMRLPLIIVFTIIGSMQIYPFISQVRREIYPEGYYATNEATTTVKDEYMPIWVHSIPSDRTVSRIQTVTGSAEIETVFLSSQKIIANINAQEQSIIQVNTVYFPGWGITLNGVLQPIHSDNPFGFMQIDIPPGNHRFFAEFRETPLRFAADVLSFMSAGIILYLALRRNVMI